MVGFEITATDGPRQKMLNCLGLCDALCSRIQLV